MDNENEILEELKKIREALEKAPPPTPPKGIVERIQRFSIIVQSSWLSCCFRLRFVSWRLGSSACYRLYYAALRLSDSRLVKLSYLCGCGWEAVVWHRRLLNSSNYLHLCGTYRVPHSEGSQKMENRLNFPSFSFFKKSFF